MVRCYDCAQPIQDEEIVRRTVQTGTSFGRRSSRTYYHKVNLCPACSASRDRTSLIRGIVLMAVGGSVLSVCVCGGLLKSSIPPSPVMHTAATQDTTVSVHELIGTVTFVDPSRRRVGLRHDGIPGRLAAGDHTFGVALGADAPADRPWPGAPVGQKIVFVLDSRTGQWVITKFKESPDR